ncbi:PAS domain-containing sensor histidine kinase [Methanobacterium oryzae]|uniref:PAS domain-containing sensor histidine kinase n=1 Tax=Methanobacterium oryzae TaxID=69540 RepID=UPI003D1B75E4
MNKPPKSSIPFDSEFLSIFEQMEERLNIFKLVYNKEGELVDLIIKYVNYPIEFSNQAPDKIIGKKLSDVLGYENIKPYLKIAREITPSMKNIKFEHYYPPNDQYFLTSAFRTPNDLVITISMDITEQKKTKGELQSSEQILKNILENFPGVVFWKDTDSVYLGCNKNFSEAAGLKDTSEIVGKTDYELPWADTEAEAYRADDKYVMKSGVPKLNIIETQLQFSGRIAWFNTSKVPLFGPEDKVIGVLGVSNDITDLKKTEEELIQARDHLEEQVQKQTIKLQEAYNSLKETESQFRTLSENSPDLIIRINKDLKYLYVNSTIEKHTGKPPEFYIGKTIDEIELPEKYTSYFKKNYLKLFKTGVEIHDEYEFPAISGLRFFKTSVVPEYNAKGEVETALVLTRDITERKELEDNLNEMVGELERSNRELQQFAYIISHDLQEPLRTVTSFTQLLEMRYKGKLDKDADEFIGYIVDGSIRMKQMIQDLLEFSRVTTKGGEFKPTNIEKLLKQTLSSIKTVIDENNAEITYDSLPIVIADDKQIQRVFQNLILNAIKFKKPNEPPKIHVSSTKDEENNEYVFSISDNGIGIEKQYFDRIFAIFQRLHTREEYAGTGIGLSVVKRTIERHGGRIWVESEVGKGSTFYFTIPSESTKNE